MFLGRQGRAGFAKEAQGARAAKPPRFATNGSAFVMYAEYNWAVGVCPCKRPFSPHHMKMRGSRTQSGQGRPGLAKVFQAFTSPSP